MQPELNSELEKIHIQIANLLGLSRELLTFNYITEDVKTTLRLATMGPRHQQIFLYHSITGFGEMDALHKMQDYVQENKNTISTYTIQWSMEDNNELFTSYFTGKNIYEVLDKFYYDANIFKTSGASGAGVFTNDAVPDKAITGTIIFNISLNPIS